jgi:hypothetical protein
MPYRLLRRTTFDKRWAHFGRAGAFFWRQQVNFGKLKTRSPSEIILDGDLSQLARHQRGARHHLAGLAHHDAVDAESAVRIERVHD